jgi:hypothetical protein
MSIYDINQKRKKKKKVFPHKTRLRRLKNVTLLHHENITTNQQEKEKISQFTTLKRGMRLSLQKLQSKSKSYFD